MTLLLGLNGMKVSALEKAWDEEKIVPVILEYSPCVQKRELIWFEN
jgi:hypothetical protein